MAVRALGAGFERVEPVPVDEHRGDPPALFRREIEAGQLVRPFDVEADVGSYWLTRLMSRAPTPAMAAFAAWFKATFAEGLAAG